MNNNFKKIRIKSEKTQAEIANILNITSQAYGKYENQERKPDPETLCKLADYFGVTIDYLLGREEETGYNIASNSLTAEELQIIAKYRKASDTMREMVNYALDIEETQANKIKKI